MIHHLGQLNRQHNEQQADNLSSAYRKKKAPNDKGKKRLQVNHSDNEDDVDEDF